MLLLLLLEVVNASINANYKWSLATKMHVTIAMIWLRWYMSPNDTWGKSKIGQKMSLIIWMAPYTKKQSQAFTTIVASDFKHRFKLI